MIRKILLALLFLSLLPIVYADSIAIDLEYNKDSFYDEDNDGEESIKGVVDLTVENTEFNWDVNEDKLCTRWNIFDTDEEKSTTICYGSQDCCAFVDLAPSKQEWNETLYLTYGRYGASFNNIAGAQVMHVDFNLSVEKPYSEIYYSEWEELPVKFYDETTSNADSIEDKINSVVKYGEQYEMGQISYLQMIVYSTVLRHDINEMLSEKIEVQIDGPVKYGATEEEMRRIFGAPEDFSPWVWVAHEDKEIRIDERLPHWGKTIFDGKKLQISFNAWPEVLREEDGSLTKFYVFDFRPRFKRKWDFNIDSMLSDIKNMAESFLETNEGSQELAERMVEYRNILHHYLMENWENCLKAMKEFFEDDEMVSDIDQTRWEIYLYEGDNLELRAEVNTCDGCEWPGVDIWFDVRMQDVRSKEAEIKFKKFNKEKYQAMTIDELNSLMEKKIAELARKAEQADRSRSGNIIRDKVEIRAEIRIINWVLDEKYYDRKDESGIQEIYRTRMQVLEDIFSKYGDIYMYPLKEVNFGRMLLENIEEQQDVGCRELKHDECSKDDVCWEGECINATGGDETCDNKVDDDGDHAIDCDDPDCSLECGRACDYICSGECADCGQEQCWGLCEDECWPCYYENRNNMDQGNPCESTCQECDECIYNQCQSQPVCDECNACHEETYKCFGICSSCKECEEQGLGGCEEQCGQCNNCKTTDNQRECLDFCGTLGDERVDEHVVRCKDMCRQDVIFICPTGRQYTPCENVDYECNGTLVRSVPCTIYDCEDGIKQTAPCGQEVMCGVNQYANVDKCVCEEGFFDCDDNNADCESDKECWKLSIENCTDRIDNDEDGLTDCQDLLDCKTGATCSQGPAGEPRYCYEGDCAFTTCGNGICDADETLYSCPADCKRTKCGDDICSGNETKESCSEDCLICPPGQILNKKGICVDPVICPIGHSKVNDTCVPPPKKCLKEGENTMEVKDCCPGLKAIRTQVGDGRICSLTVGYVCTAFCGDGNCGEGENPCNCKKDCPIPKVNVSCTTNADCGADTCHQGRNICSEYRSICENDGSCSAVSTKYEDYSCARYYSPELPYPESTKCLDTCGDGICKRPENRNWCPEDCKKRVISCEDNLDCPKEMKCENSLCVDVGCIKEGETGPSAGINPEWLDHLPKECCEGLTSITYSGLYDENCNLKMMPGAPSFTCVKYGDGQCGKGETKCNCPEDCIEKELCGNKVIDREENCANCPQDVSCKDDFVCKNKKCVPEKITCPEGQEVSEEGLCVDICGNGKIDEKENCESCPQDASCKDDFVCKNKKCVPELEVCPEGMEPGEAGKCVYICGNGKIDEKEDCDSCPQDVACEGGFSCKNKKCVPEKITCPDDYVLNKEGICEFIIECKKNQKLTDQGCVPIEDDCRQDDDCIGKEECKAGVCVAPPKPKCETDEGCPKNKICSDGICVKNIETPGPPEPEPTGEECILISDCSGENDICSNGECKEIPEEFIEKEEEEEIPEEEEEEIEEEPEEKGKKEKGKEEPEEEIVEEEEEEKPKEEKKEEKKPESKKEEGKEGKPTEEPEPEPVQEEPPAEEPMEEITGESVLDTITGFVTSILGLAVEDAENRCKEDSDCGTNQNCEYFMGNCHCKEYFFDCNSGDAQGNDEDGCESEDPTCGGKREMCGGKCQENQHCDEERGHCMCDEGFWECDGYWENGCESDEKCEVCEDDSDCMQDVCAPGDIKTVINIGCVQGSTWNETTDSVGFYGNCNFHPTGAIYPDLGFHAEGKRFEQVQWYQEVMEQFERQWCEFKLEDLTKEREKLQENYNLEFLAWFFEEYVNSEPDRWDDYSGGIYDVYHRFVENSDATNRQLRCLNLNKFPSEYELIDEIEYESEYGYLKFWEEKAVLDGVEIFSPFMQIWVFPPKEFVKENFRTSMEKGVMPGPPGEEKPGLSPAEIKEAKQDKKFMKEITDISDEFGGSADFLITINDDEEILYRAMLTINPEIIFNFEIKNIDREPDVTISVDFDFMHGIIETIEQERELERPPWDEKPRIGKMIKGAIDKGKMLAKLTGAIATGKIKVSPLSQVGKVTQVLGFMFDQGPKEKGPKDKEKD